MRKGVFSGLVEYGEYAIQGLADEKISIVHTRRLRYRVISWLLWHTCRLPRGGSFPVHLRNRPKNTGKVSLADCLCRRPHLRVLLGCCEMAKFADPVA